MPSEAKHPFIMLGGRIFRLPPDSFTARKDFFRASPYNSKKPHREQFYYGKKNTPPAGGYFLPSPMAVPLDLFHAGELHLGHVFGSGASPVT
jgi:hypothetical protein